MEESAASTYHSTESHAAWISSFTKMAASGPSTPARSINHSISKLSQWLVLLLHLLQHLEVTSLEGDKNQ